VTSKDFKGDLDRFESCIEALRDLSENARIFCLIHKMDLLAENQRETIFQEKQNKIRELCGKDFSPRTEVFKTSIWDETLYRAWS
jgi:Ras-related GTP-binding protein A/B